MLARSASVGQIPSWKRELARAYTRPTDLLHALGLDHTLLPGAQAAARDFRLLAPRGYVALMEHGNPDDPLLRQVLPLAEETQVRPGFGPDPVGDQAAVQTPGLLQKYRGRALLMATGACAIHCRYCFRRHFAYAEGAAVHDGARAALRRLRELPEIAEVILSGGDPLMLDDETLAGLLQALEAVGHLRRLRLHTRMPVVLPERITSGLCRLLADGRLQTLVVIHVNHPRELGEAAAEALGRLRQAGLVLLNQSVLLRGVNDQAQVLAGLSEALFAQGVLPYYLHQLDRVQGGAHFEVPDATAKTLLERLRERLPGYLVPRLVREEVGQGFKRPLG